MKVETLTGTMMDSNTYLLWDDACTACVLIDPSGDAAQINRALTARALPLQAVLLTHGHFDHINLVDNICSRYNVPVYVHTLDAPMLADARKNLSVLFGTSFVVKSPVITMQHGDVIDVGTQALLVLHTPGHTPGGVCFYADGVVISGDTLFAGSVGRTDFPQGSMTQLMTSIATSLATLPRDTQVYPGHGQTTSMERELRENPYLHGGNAWSF